MKRTAACISAAEKAGRDCNSAACESCFMLHEPLETDLLLRPQVLDIFPFYCEGAGNPQYNTALSRMHVMFSPVLFDSVATPRNSRFYLSIPFNP